MYLINVAMGWVKQKKELELDPKYKLPKMRYKGDNGVTPQTMRMDTKPLVTEMRDIPADPEFPLLTKRRPITVPGPPKASKQGPKADVPTSVNRVEPDKATHAVANLAAQAKQTSLPSSSPVLKKPAVQPKPSNIPVTATARSGSAVQSGVLLNPLLNGAACVG